VKLIIAIITLRGLEILIDDLLKKNNLNEKSDYFIPEYFQNRVDYLRPDFYYYFN